MFGFVPSPTMMSSHMMTTSPQSLSIYDTERPDIQSSFCGGSSIFTSKHRSDPTLVEDAVLDDKYEDSNLKHMLTPELFNSINVLPSVQWEGKPMCEDSDSGANLPLLNDINMDSEIGFMDIFSYDTDDSKMSFPSLDLFTSDLKSNNSSSCHTPVPVMCVEPTSIASNTQSHHDHKKGGLISSEEFKPLLIAHEQNIVSSDQGMDRILKKAPMKSNFPPRDGQPPKVGIVAPVSKKRPEGLEAPVKSEQKPDLSELKSHHYKNSKCMNSVSTIAYSFNDAAPQTVPSCESLKRGHGTVKSEPESPAANKKLRMEANDDFWGGRTIDHKEKREDWIYPQRRRYDSGGSGHTSDSADEDTMKEVDDSDDDDDISDIDADITSESIAGCESLIGPGKKQKQFFWQYNVQAKGPKGTRLKLAVDSPKDFHVLNNFEDPVFDECNTVVAGIRHGGKARKGDGNEITPNPKKLVFIGHQLLRLNKKINSFQLGSDVPIAKRNESRKEKNKLASRACRLKKKAQHEANKIKLHGLEEEHTQLNSVVQQIWPKVREQVKTLLKQGQLNNGTDKTPVLTGILDNYISKTLKSKVATETTDYVNNTILKVEAGDMKGGLNIQRKKI